jgi:hypothetical protein
LVRYHETRLSEAPPSLSIVPLTSPLRITAFSYLYNQKSGLPNNVYMYLYMNSTSPGMRRASPISFLFSIPLRNFF